MIKILVIEDEPSLREEILDLLEANGFEGVEVEDGAAGIVLAQTPPRDLILYDVRLPEADSYDVLATLLQYSDTALIPFNFLTAKVTHDDVRQRMSVGTDDYLMKPFGIAELLNAIAARSTQQAPIAQIYQKVNEAAILLVEKLAKRLSGKVQIISKAGWTQLAIQLPVQTNLPIDMATNKYARYSGSYSFEGQARGLSPLFYRAFTI